MNFNPHVPRVRDDPFDMYRALRQESPLHWIPEANAWVVSRYAEVSRILRDRRFRSSPHHLDRYAAILTDNGIGTHLVDTSRHWFLFRDDERHRAMHAALQHLLGTFVELDGPGVITKIVEDLLSEFGDEGVVDLIPRFVAPLPIRVIARLFGFPTGDAEGLSRWTLAVSRTLDPYVTIRQLARASEGLEAWLQYFDLHIEERRVHPRFDLMSQLIELEVLGARLDHDELRSTAILLFFGGHVTTIGLIGHALMLLAEDRVLADRLRRDNALVTPFIEEVLRLEGSAQMVARTASCDVDVDGVTIRDGQHVVLLLGSANRDEARYSEADRVLLDREGRHLAFSQGAHYCIGAALARLEAEIAVRSVLRELAAFEVVGRAVRYPSFTFRWLRSLPLAYCRRSREGSAV